MDGAAGDLELGMELGVGWRGKCLSPLVGCLSEIKGMVKPSERIFPTMSAVPWDCLGRLKDMHEQRWGGCYWLSPLLPGSSLGEEEKSFHPKTHHLPHPSDISCRASVSPACEAPLPDPCRNPAQAEDFSPRQHLLPEQCPAWRPGAPGARNLSLLFVIQMNPWGGGEAWGLHSS